MFKSPLERNQGRTKGQTDRRTVTMAMVVSLLALISSKAWGMDWPTRAVRLVVPYAAGNQADTVSRLMAEELSREYGQPFIVENAGGAGGALGVGQIARAKPDGYTLGVAAIASLAVVPHLQRVTYDPKKDLEIVSAVTEVRVMGLAVGKSVPATNLADLVKFANSRADRPLTFSTAGAGTLFHLDMELVSSALNQKFTHIPYRGSGSGISDVIGGQVDMVFDVISLLRPQADAGNLKIIAVTDSKAAGPPPGVQSFSEQRVKADVKTPWQMILAPRGLPDGIRKRLESSIARMVQSSSFKAKLPMGTEPLLLNGKAAVERMLRESEIFGSLARTHARARGQAVA
jgi:tripartite-type tricarboxylate transporter receptor subunit TctC